MAGLSAIAGVSPKFQRPRYSRYRVGNEAKINVELVVLLEIESIPVTAVVIAGRTKALSASTPPVPDPYTA